MREMAWVMAKILGFAGILGAEAASVQSHATKLKVPGSRGTSTSKELIVADEMDAPL